KCRVVLLVDLCAVQGGVVAVSVRYSGRASSESAENENAAQSRTFHLPLLRRKDFNLADRSKPARDRKRRTRHRRSGRELRNGIPPQRWRSVKDRRWRCVV